MSNHFLFFCWSAHLTYFFPNQIYIWLYIFPNYINHCCQMGLKCYFKSQRGSKNFDGQSSSWVHEAGQEAHERLKVRSVPTRWLRSVGWTTWDESSRGHMQNFYDTTLLHFAARTEQSAALLNHTFPAVPAHTHKGRYDWVGASQSLLCWLHANIVPFLISTNYATSEKRLVDFEVATMIWFFF